MGYMFSFQAGFGLVADALFVLCVYDPHQTCCLLLTPSGYGYIDVWFELQ